MRLTFPKTRPEELQIHLDDLNDKFVEFDKFTG